MDVTVSELIAHFLRRMEITHIFGVPGAHILPVFDGLCNADIKVILTKHEQGAAFMAGGYAVSSGKVGACIATTGPGATNLVTGIANAYVNGTPVLAITGETPTYSFGKGALQESSGDGTAINQNDIFRGITRYHKIIQRTDYLAQTLRFASNHLLSVLPGPVLLSFPYNLLREKVDLSILDDVEFSKPIVPEAGCSGRLEGVLKLMEDSKSPVIVAGWGCVAAGVEKEILSISSDLGIPVATSLKARAVIPETSVLSLGILGITSKELACKYISEQADLIILLGIGFGERTSYNWNPKLLHGKKIIHVDIDHAQLGKVFKADISLCCDVRIFLKDLDQSRRTYHLEKKDTSRLPLFREDYGQSKLNDEDFSLVSNVLRRLTDYLGDDVLIFDDNIIYMQHFVSIHKSGGYYPNSGISSLGHAVPAAIGAKVTTSKPAVAIIGDGGFQMCCMELMTSVNYQIPVTVVLLNNSCLGLVRKNQHYNYARRYIASDFINPDYSYLARSFGINHRRISSINDVDDIFSMDLHKGINLIEVIMNKDQFPSYSSGR